MVVKYNRRHLTQALIYKRMGNKETRRYPPGKSQLIMHTTENIFTTKEGFIIRGSSLKINAVSVSALQTEPQAVKLFLVSFTPDKS